ncbi:hypothetical protein AJ79_05894 [Helicocarpus griseus UAMH5409]|uniref:FHA domain-containing protein n=1 Tax=Helicocarpus griseus UAMH5409 TaxID=1447875 RepID=A0A2B7XIN6_9EURO|nr:hypothetical protein AJ79_05894 [Helicocarpus griseus UAMH5409]
MEHNKLALTLTPLNFEDPIPRRDLTLSSDNHEIVIGRSSKVVSKNLLPKADNAWFDSRVMSRNHAVITVCTKKQEASVMDTDSMHGTLLNGTNLVSNCKTILMNRDVLTFGTKVTRGAESFDPLKVRLLLSWSKEHEPADKEPQKSSTHRSVNTFSVPDDDDEEELGEDDDRGFDDPQAEAIFENTSDLEALSREPSIGANSAVSAPSSVENDNDGNLTPLSSDTKCENNDGKEPIPEIPAAEPASSKIPYPSIVLEDHAISGAHDPEHPSDVGAESEKKSAQEQDASDCYGKSNAVAEHHAFYESELEDDFDEPFDEEDPYSASDSEDSCIALGAKINEIKRAVAEASKPENIDSLNQAKPAVTWSSESLKTNESPAGSGNPDSLMIPPNPARYDPVPLPAVGHPAAKPTSNSPRFYANLNSTVSPSVLAYQPVQSGPARNGGSDSSPGAQRARSPSDKALPKRGVDWPPSPPDPYSVNPQGAWGMPTGFGSPGQGWRFSALSTDYDFPHLPPLRPPYSDGPFAASTDRDPWGSEKPACPSTSDNVQPTTYNYRQYEKDSCPSSFCQSTNPYFQPDLFRPVQPATSEPVRREPFDFQKISEKDIYSRYRQEISAPAVNDATGEKQSAKPVEPASSLKRKAEELEEDPEAESEVEGEAGSEVERMPDPQPKDMDIHAAMVSQLTDPAPEEAPAVVEKPENRSPQKSAQPEKPENGPPQKKVKTETRRSDGSNFARYAASALVGAAVGGIGVITALASLPPDFFN